MAIYRVRLIGKNVATPVVVTADLVQTFSGFVRFVNRHDEYGIKEEMVRMFKASTVLEAEVIVDADGAD